jgi:hypothetical protein
MIAKSLKIGNGSQILLTIVLQKIVWIWRFQMASISVELFFNNM